MPTIFSTHSFSKTVFIFPLPITWLKCSLHLLKKKKKNFLKNKKIKKKILKRKNRIKKKIVRKKKKIKSRIIKEKESFLLEIVRFKEELKSNFKLKINFGLKKIIQSFFKKIHHKVQEYKREYNRLSVEEKKRIKLKELERQEKEKEEKKRIKLVEFEKQEIEKKEIEIQKKAEESLKIKLKEKELKDEIRLEKERARDIKKFLRQEQAFLRKEQAERQRKFLQELKIERQIEKFRIREVKELEKLEKISLQEKRENYAELQERIDKLKEKYQLIRDQKIRERVESLGVKIQEGDDRGILLQKEREYTLARQKIETALESFYRSANSLVFQLNKRHITRHMSIFRCIDRRFETGEIFIKWDEVPDDEWLILIYIKDNSPDKEIIIEDKSNPEKNVSNEFKPSEIFKASDMMVDSLTQLLARERGKKEN